MSEDFDYGSEWASHKEEALARGYNAEAASAYADEEMSYHPLRYI